jgi:predicted transcriptional regulator
MIDKETIRDLASDLPSLGLLVVILAKPDDWRVRPEQLAKELSVSRSKAYRMLGRLIDAGYIVRADFRRRLPNGTFERRCCYSVYEDRSMVPKLKEVPTDRFYETRLDGEEVPF